MDEHQIEKISALIKERLLAGESVLLKGIEHSIEFMNRSTFPVTKKGERLLILLKIPYSLALKN